VLNSKSFLAGDFGASTLKLAEFETNEVGGLRLINYGVKTLGEAAQDPAREQAILRALQELISQGGFRAKNINACAPGFHVFSKFVKLPPVDTGKVAQIIEYEAKQNVPFPLEEVVWDYQIVGTSPQGELEVLLVAVKKDIVETLSRTGESSGLRMQLVDVSPAALCNAFRYNYGDMESEGCSMLLDIGAKTSNLLFFEKGKFYSRSINIGANSITQDFVNEAKVKFGEAETLKIEKGFVSLGGAYEEPDDPQAAAISKIARQVMTRLHIQVNQTIQFYRGQQGGGAPQRLFLSGGASVMAYTAQFFAEKLNVPVDYFNPFRNVQIAPNVNVEDLSRYAHCFGEVVGLGLRNLAHCPVELNLMPETSIQRQEFQQKKPYLVAAAFTVAAVVFAIAWFYGKVVSIKRTTLDDLKAQVQPLMQKEAEMREAKGELERMKGQTDKLIGLLELRGYWGELLTELRRVCIETENKAKQKLNADTGLWVESFAPAAITASAAPADGQTPPPEGQPTDGSQVDPATQSYDRGGGTPPPATEFNALTIVCRSVDREGMSPTANSDLAYALKAELEASPFFQKDGLELEPIKKEEGSPTFSFGLTVRLKRPFKASYAMD
jgi:type IV pilus assembly protein PilM